MILVEKNWENTPFKLHKEIIVNDLFDKVVSQMKITNGELTNKNELDLYVKTWFRSFCSNLTFFWENDEDISKYYICTYKVLPSGAKLISFIAKLKDCIEPVRLELMY